MRVRRARAEDRESIVRLWREMWDFHAPLDGRFHATPMANQVMSEWIEENLASDRSGVFVAEQEDRDLAGYCLAMILENPPVVPWPFYGYISEIAVHSRRRGIGGKLLGAAHDWFREQSVSYVEVNVSVQNPVARSFWRKQGYGEFLERLRREL
jgi:ribosomal protein S18 acetylase RimI-like enzyme